MGWFGQNAGEAGDAPVGSGTLLIEYRHLPSGRPYNVVRARVRDPMPSGVTLRVDPCGAIRLLLSGGGCEGSYKLPLFGVPAGARVILRYVWRLRDRTGVLSANVVEQDRHVTEVVTEAVGFAAGELVRLMAAQEAEAGVVIAVSDDCEPVGPMPGVCGAAQVRLMDGVARMDRLRQGDVLMGADGDPLQIRWAGAVDLPTGGYYGPTLIRAPQFGAWRDLWLGQHQPIVLGGTEVEYLFAAPSIRAAAGDLVMESQAAGAAVRRYHQVALDRDVPMVIDGVLVPGLDMGPMREDPDLAAHSVLGAFPRELMPVLEADRAAPLQPFEARSLSRVRAAAQVPMLGVS